MVVPLRDLGLVCHRFPLLAVRSYVTVRSSISTTIWACYAERREVGRQGADQHVALALDLADLCLPNAEDRGQLRLCQTGFSAYGGKVNHF